MNETASRPSARVRLYTTPYCGYCTSAKQLLRRQGIAYEEHDVGQDHALRERLSHETGWRTVPMIFVEERFVGGYTELAALNAKGGLAHLRPA